MTTDKLKFDNLLKSGDQLVAASHSHATHAPTS